MDRLPYSWQAFKQLPWRSRLVWQRIGYVLTAAWMIGILAATNENVRDPLFQFIFIVPLAGWIIGVVVGRLVTRFWPPAPSDEQAGRRPPRP
ncbi:MAG TPA: hypothetical protein VKY65_02760 [Alphaproteobacteria bacterium]|nr:hypothetical protein [Alphaproteobacteria bacterium]